VVVGHGAAVKGWCIGGWMEAWWRWSPKSSCMDRHKDDGRCFGLGAMMEVGTWCHDGGQDTRQSTATASVVLRVDDEYLGENPGGTDP